MAVGSVGHISMDWLKGKFTGKAYSLFLKWENLWFPLKIFPYTNPL